ncbi:MAG: hypothetical protein M3144_12685 [Actinomycetota bacterium]|nr:hypothetical protein [Actinomycetota bacterium]
MILPEPGEEAGAAHFGDDELAGTGGPAQGNQDLTLEEAARLYKFPIDRLRRRASSGGLPGAYTVTTAEGTEWRVPRAALAALGYRPVAELALEREVRSRFGPDRVAGDESELEPRQVLQRPLPPKVQVRITPGGAEHGDAASLRRQLDEERRQIEAQKAQIQRAGEELERQRTKDLERHRDELKLMLEKLVADRRQLEADRKRLTEQSVEEEFRLQRESDRLAAEAAAQRARFEMERSELDEEWAEAEDRLERAERLETEHAAEQRRLESARREIEREERRLRRRRERLDEERRQLDAERQQLDADRAELDAEREQLEEERADLALERRRVEDRASRRREPARPPEPARQAEPVPEHEAVLAPEPEAEWRAPSPTPAPAAGRASEPEPEPEPELEPEVVAEEPRPRAGRAGRAARREERSRQQFTAGRWKLAERTRVALSTPAAPDEAVKDSDGGAEAAPAPSPRRSQAPRQNGGNQSSKFRVISPVWVDPEGQYCPPTHPIKAKLSSGLFHLPGMWAYDRTWPDRCYRDGEAAEAAGLTRAKR